MLFLYLKVGMGYWPLWLTFKYIFIYLLIKNPEKAFALQDKNIRWRIQKNGLAQRSVLAVTLLIIYNRDGQLKVNSGPIFRKFKSSEPEYTIEKR
jgi:hypothetical protein